MRTVLSSHSEVAHFWANRIQSEVHSGNVFFEGDSIYSYGTHFELARRVKPHVVLFNPESYSSSTSKHHCTAVGLC